LTILKLLVLKKPTGYIKTILYFESIYQSKLDQLAPYIDLTQSNIKHIKSNNKLDLFGN